MLAATTLDQKLLASRRRAARTFRAAGQMEKARTTAKSIVTDFGDTPQDALFLAACHSDLGDYAGAAAALHGVLEVAPSHLPARLALARALANQVDFPAAIVAAEAALKIDPLSMKAALLLGWLYRKTGNIEGERRAYKAAAAADPRSIRALVGQAAACRRLGRTQEALAQIESALELDPQHIAALCLRAFVLADAEADATVLEPAFSAAIAAAPESLLLRQALASARTERGDLSGAVEALAGADDVTTDPAGQARLRAKLSNTFLQMGEETLAREWAGRAADTAAVFNHGVIGCDRIEALSRQAAAVAPAMPDIPFERAMIESAQRANASERAVDWALQRLTFGRLAAGWTLISSLAAAHAPDPWLGLIDDGALRRFVEEKPNAPVLLVGGHIGPPVVLQSRLSRIAPDIHCLSSNGAFWLSRTVTDRFIPAHAPSRALLSVFDRLRQGDSVFIGADGLLGARNMSGQVFGHRTRWASGAAMLALRTSAVVVGCHALWQGDRMTISIVPGPKPREAVSPAAWLAAFSDWYSQMIEGILRADPANYRPNSYRYFGLD